METNFNNKQKRPVPKVIHSASKPGKAITKKEVKSIVESMINNKTELKSYDVGFATTVSSAASITKISSIPQGDTDTTRDGDKLSVRQVQIRGDCVVADTTNIVRVMCICWNFDDASSAPTLALILQDAVSSPWLSPYQRDSVRQNAFSVVYDEVFALSSTGPQVEVFKANKRWNGKQIAYDAASTAGVGNYYMVCVSDSTAVPHPFVAWTSRVEFVDM